jgi:hypothetical protein
MILYHTLDLSHRISIRKSKFKVCNYSTQLHRPVPQRPLRERLDVFPHLIPASREVNGRCNTLLPGRGPWTRQSDSIGLWEKKIVELVYT